MSQLNLKERRTASPEWWPNECHDGRTDCDDILSKHEALVLKDNRPGWHVVQWPRGCFWLPTGDHRCARENAALVLTLWQGGVDIELAANIVGAQMEKIDLTNP